MLQATLSCLSFADNSKSPRALSLRYKSPLNRTETRSFIVHGRIPVTPIYTNAHINQEAPTRRGSPRIGWRCVSKHDSEAEGWKALLLPRNVDRAQLRGGPYAHDLPRFSKFNWNLYTFKLKLSLIFNKVMGDVWIIRFS